MVRFRGVFDWICKKNVTKKDIENYKEDPKTMTFMRLSRADSISNAELKYADWKRMAKVRDGDILNQKISE